MRDERQRRDQPMFRPEGEEEFEILEGQRKPFKYNRRYGTYQ